MNPHDARICALNEIYASIAQEHANQERVRHEIDRLIVEDVRRGIDTRSLEFAIHMEQADIDDLQREIARLQSRISVITHELSKKKAHHAALNKESEERRSAIKRLYDEWHSAIASAELQLRLFEQQTKVPVDDYRPPSPKPQQKQRTTITNPLGLTICTDLVIRKDDNVPALQHHTAVISPAKTPPSSSRSVSFQSTGGLLKKRTPKTPSSATFPQYRQSFTKPTGIAKSHVSRKTQRYDHRPQNSPQENHAYYHKGNDFDMSDLDTFGTNTVEFVYD